MTTDSTSCSPQRIALDDPHGLGATGVWPVQPKPTGETPALPEHDALSTCAAATGSRDERPGAQGENRYIYCVCDWDQSVRLGPVGVGDEPAEVFTVVPCEKGLAAVVSPTRLDKYEISRKNLLAHQKLMEMVMASGHTVLPVKFNTIAEVRGGKPAEQDIIDRVLKGRREELAGLMDFFRLRAELGIKGLWSDMAGTFGQIVRDNPDIALLRQKLSPGAPGAERRPGETGMRMRLGERVKQALDAKKAAAQQELLAALGRTVCDVRTNPTFGDAMFANLSLLVESFGKSSLAEFEGALSAYKGARGAEVKLRYVGPLPPSSFLELVIDWEG